MQFPMDTPNVVLVTACRNAVETIDATIWSIVSQAGDFYLCYHVQDGASTDGTIAKLEDWEKRLAAMMPGLPNRLKFTWASEPDSGMYEAINRGFARLPAQPNAFMGWLNGDDVLWPGAVDALTRLARDLPEADWVMGWPSWTDISGRFTHIERNPCYPRSILAAGLADGDHWPFLQQETTFWRRRLWDGVGGVRSDMRAAGDWDLWRRFAERTSLLHAHRQLGTFRVRTGQISADAEAYKAELNGLCPHAHRRQLLARALDDPTFFIVSAAVENAEGVWQPCQRQARGPRADRLRKLLHFCPKRFLTRNLLRYLW